MIASKNLGLSLGFGAAAAFIGYCVYFDRRRRSAPDFKAKLREKRRAAAKKAKSSSSNIILPDFSDNEAVQRFFLQEVQIGEECLAQGDIASGVEHLSIAVAVCGQPHSLLAVLQQTLPPHIYSNLLCSLDIAQKKVRSQTAQSIQGMMQGSGRPFGGPSSTMVEDVE